MSTGMIAGTSNDNASDNLELATFTTSRPCEYHRGNALHVYDLTLEHAGGRVLFQSADCSLIHGNITGLVGTNGAGKSSLALVLASRQLDGFPASDAALAIEYLAAADDQDGHSEAEGTTMKLSPKEYIHHRLQDRLNQVRQSIEELEESMEDADQDEVERTAEKLSSLYETEEAMMERMERETNKAMDQVGLKAHSEKTLGQLSCGWRYKCRLIAAILSHPDLLIIDEPSFLDAKSTTWLVHELRRMANVDQVMILLISHKEALLEELCDRMIHINSANQTLVTYNCGYSQFRTALEAGIQYASKTLEETQGKLDAADKSLKHVQKELKRREGNFQKVVRQGEDKRFIKGKNKEAKQKADKSAASRLQKAQQAVTEAHDLRSQAKRERVKALHIEGLPADGTLVTLESVGFRYENDEDWVFEHVDTSLEASDRVLLQGDNGCGKTTLIKLILDEISPTEGSIHRTTENIMYFPQTALRELLQSHGCQTPLELLNTISPMTETSGRMHLGDYGLTKDLPLRPMHTLSAGQRVRVWLAVQALRHPTPSLLILDEVSENVDVETRKSLVDLLANFNGAVIVISHDPDFCESFSFTKRWKLWRHGMQVEFPE